MSSTDVDLVFTPLENPEAYNSARKKLDNLNVKDTLLDCTDAHALSSTLHKFELAIFSLGSKPALRLKVSGKLYTEFEQRVFVGDTPSKRLLVSNNRTKYASAITIRKKTKSSLHDTWFDVELPLNYDLVAIIGNKGSGKSALADVIALIGDTKNHGSFSFLNEKRFRDRSKLAAHFWGSLRWQDETDSQKDLHENPTPSSVERIKYLTQSYLETLCNELAGGGSSTFDRELRKIIYTHVPEEDRLCFQSLDELLNFKVSEIETERRDLVKDMSKLNVETVEVGHKLSPEFRQSLTQQFDARKKEMVAFEHVKPTPVDDPLESDAV